MRIRTTLAGALAAVLATTVAGPASAASTDPVKLDREPTAAEWDSGRVSCLLTITGISDTREMLHGDPECWIVAKGDTTPPWSRTSTDALAGAVEGSASTLAGFTTVGTHYDNTNFTGSTLTVAGTVCSSGWLNVPGSWVNRIGSTISPCWVGHYDGNNLTGASEWGSYISLTFLNNATNSIVYT